jgi:alpha-D-xyloside xylohydrolase
MKFSNGCWLQKEGVECFAPQEVYYSKVEETCVTLCAPTNKIITRGDTLGGINLTLKITSPQKGVIRVQTWHHMGLLQKSPRI